jgi:hypothetical protein
MVEVDRGTLEQDAQGSAAWGGGVAANAERQVWHAVNGGAAASMQQDSVLVLI